MAANGLIIVLANDTEQGARGGAAGVGNAWEPRCGQV